MKIQHADILKATIIYMKMIVCSPCKQDEIRTEDCQSGGYLLSCVGDTPLSCPGVLPGGGGGGSLSSPLTTVRTGLPPIGKDQRAGVMAHLHPVTVTRLRHRCDINSMHSSLYCYTWQKWHHFDITPKRLCNPFGSDVANADASLSLNINGPLTPPPPHTHT